jgi:cytochrome c-type biogenesis protein CcmH/NrfG
MRLAYILIASLVVCSMLAVAIATIDFSGLWNDGEGDVVVDPNADLIAEQETVVARNPEDVDDVVLLANLLANTGRMHEATEWYERALEIAPQDTGVRLDFARSLQANGLNTDAEAQFNVVLEADPDNLSGHYYLAKLYMTWKPQRQSEARDHFMRVVEINPTSFLAEQAQVELDTMNQTTPISSPELSTPVAGP